MLSDEPAEAVQRDERGHVVFPFGEEVVLDCLGAVLVPVLVGDSWSGTATPSALAVDLPGGDSIPRDDDFFAAAPRADLIAGYSIGSSHLAE